METIYKKILPILLILVVLIAGTAWGLTFLFHDPEVSAYRSAISGIQSQEVYHAVHTYTYTERESTDIRTTEIYRSYPNYSEEYKQNGTTSRFQVCYEGYIHTAMPLNTWEAEDYESVPPIFNIDPSYYRTNIQEKDITIEKTGSGYVCTYPNRFRIGKDAYDDKNIGPVETAAMVSYFDEEWNFQRLLITETHTQTLADGSTFPVTRTDEIVYYPTSAQQIDAMLAEYADRYQGPPPPHLQEAEEERSRQFWRDLYGFVLRLLS